jgi:hypothetical protein
MSKTFITSGLGLGPRVVAFALASIALAGSHATSPKENMTPAGLAPAPVAVFTCSREARRLIKSGLKGVHGSPKRPARGRGIG